MNVKTWTRITATAVAAVVIANAIPPRAPEAYAQAGSAFQDADGDLLPDSLEWVLLTDPTLADSDSDGRDDFVEAALFEVGSNPAFTPPMDHEVRVAVTGTRAGGAEIDVWLNLLFRFPTGGFEQVTHFEPFLDTWGVQVPLSSILGQQSTRVVRRGTTSQGNYALVQLRLAPASTLRWLLPCTIGVRTTIAGKSITTGSFLQLVDNELVVFVPTSKHSFGLQTVAQDPGASAFWSSNRYCRIELDVIGSTARGQFCEVRKGTCTNGGGLRCPPTCSQAAGTVLFFPNGIGTINGG